MADDLAQKLALARARRAASQSAAARGGHHEHPAPAPGGATPTASPEAPPLVWRDQRRFPLRWPPRRPGEDLTSWGGRAMRDDVDDPMDRERRRHEAERAAYEADLYARELRAERSRREVR